MGSESSEKQPHQKGSGGGVGGGCERTEQTGAFKITTLEQRQSVQVLLLRIADLGSAMQPFSVFGNWSQRLYIENNKSSGLTQEEHAKTQQPFMTYLVLPLLEFANKYPILNTIDMYMNLARENLHAWIDMDLATKCTTITNALVVQPGVAISPYVVQSNVGNEKEKEVAAVLGDVKQ